MTTRTEASAPIIIRDDGFETRTIPYREGCVRLRLEDDFWTALDDIAARERITLSELVGMLVKQSEALPDAPLASVARSIAIAYFRQSATECGHRRAGHGPAKRKPHLTVVRGGA